jgi:ankyrin repeat protein
MSDAAARRSSLDLARAINSGDADLVTEALDRGTSPNGRGLSYTPDFGFFLESPLARAVSFDDAPLVRLLVKRGADVNAVTDNGWSALTNADAADQEDMAELLIELGADPALRTAHGYTPLHRSARRGDRDEQLHASATQAVDTRNAADETALMLAIRFGHEATAADLLRMGADPNAVASDGERQWSTLTEAAHRDTNGDQTTRLVELLLDAGADPNPPGYPPLFSCIGDTDDCVRAMRSLLDAGADPNAVNPTNQDTLVHHALKSGSDDAIEPPWV